MLLIGFGYKARQGKDTAALAMLEAAPLELQIRQYGFADGLRNEVRVAIARSGGIEHLIRTWQDAGLMPDWVKPEYPKARTLLQWWGTEYRRAQDPNYWVKKLQRTLKEHNPDVALITDVRFANEVEAIKEMGGFVVKVTRTTPADVEVSEAHASESALSTFTGWDFYLTASERRELQNKAAELFAELWEGHGLRQLNPR